MAFYFWPSQSWSSLRVEVEGRTPEEVAKKACALGTQLAPCQTVGAVWIDHKEMATGIALDRYTVLTSAHQFSGMDLNVVEFVLNKNGQEKPTNLVSGKPIVHSGFTSIVKIPRDIKRDPLTKKICILDVPLDELKDSSFEDYKEAGIVETSVFFGTDLAILKLGNPLPETTVFPSFSEDNQSFSDTDSISIGFGPLKFNRQEMGPEEVTKDPMLSSQRHVLSCKISSQTVSNVRVLVGSYKGLLVNGDESFIPEPGMMKTAGLPVKGDSGGPLFIEHDSNYELCGILSRTFTAWENLLSDASNRQIFGSYIQGVFPCWTDIRPHLKWIQSHMGEN